MTDILEPGNAEQFANQVAHEAISLRAQFGLAEAHGLLEAQSDVDPKVRETITTAKKLLDRPDVRKAICAALTSVSNDLESYAKAITGALLPLSIGPHAAIPLSSTIFAISALIVFHAGLRRLCPEEVSSK